MWHKKFGTVCDLGDFGSLADAKFSSLTYRTVVGREWTNITNLTCLIYSKKVLITFCSSVTACVGFEIQCNMQNTIDSGK